MTLGGILHHQEVKGHEQSGHVSLGAKDFDLLVIS